MVKHVKSLEKIKERNKPYENFYCYTDQLNHILFVIFRKVDEKGKKYFQIFTFNHLNDSFESGLNLELHLLTKRPLFNLFNYYNFSKNKVPVLIVEGEKCAERAIQAFGGSFWVTTWSGGASAIEKSDWSPVQFFKDIYFWPDNDAVGLEAVDKLKNIIKIPINVIDVSSFEKSYDIDDYINDFGCDNLLDFINKNSTIDIPVNLDVNSDGCVTPSFKNYLSILSGHKEWYKSIFFNEVSLCVEIHKKNPIENPKGYIPSLYKENCIIYEDKHLLRAMDWLVNNYQFKGRVIKKEINDAIDCIADKNSYNPITDYLKSISWDNVDRFSGAWFESDDNNYSYEAIKYWMMGAVKRAFEPGCKFDEVLIIQGKQKVGKTYFFEIMGGKWYAVIASSFKNKEIYNLLIGKWIIELGEMESFSKSSNSSSKVFLSTKNDTFRVPYAIKAKTMPRLNVFGTTTNDDEYLNDPTGARRYLPVYAIKIDYIYLKSNIDQLWAQIVHYYKNNIIIIYPEQAKEMQRNKYINDPWIDKIESYIQYKISFKTSDVLSEALSLYAKEQTPAISSRVCNCLKFLGYKRKSVRIVDKIESMWFKDE